MKNFIAPDCGVSCPEKKEKTTFSDKSEELITTFKSSDNPMAERIFSMADMVCLLREEIQSLLEDSRLVSVVKIFNHIGFPVSQTRLKICYANAMKVENEELEGRDGYYALKKLILGTAAARDGQNCQDGTRAACALPAGENGTSMARDAACADAR